MLAYTPNLNLVKPTYDDACDIEAINGNMDKIDTAVKGVQDKFTPDGKAIDADKLDGKGATEFAPASHVTDGNIHLTPAEKTKVLGGSNAWVATACTLYDNGGYTWWYKVTIPNFVFTDGCTITIPNIPYNADTVKRRYIQINGEQKYYIMLNSIANVTTIIKDPWSAGKPVTFTLSSYEISAGSGEKSAFYSGQQTPTNWVATNVVVDDGNTRFNLTIPNFVFTEGCKVTFKSPISNAELIYLRININGGDMPSEWWIRPVSNIYAALPTNSIGQHCTVTLTLTSTGVAVHAGSDRKTAFLNAPLISYGTSDLTAGVSSLATGSLYFAYE